MGVVALVQADELIDERRVCTAREARSDSIGRGVVVDRFGDPLGIGREESSNGFRLRREPISTT